MADRRDEQPLQTLAPQWRQWCRRTVDEKRFAQSMHPDAAASGTQSGGVAMASSKRCCACAPSCVASSSGVEPAALRTCSVAPRRTSSAASGRFAAATALCSAVSRCASHTPTRAPRSTSSEQACAEPSDNAVKTRRSESIRSDGELGERGVRMRKGHVAAVRERSEGKRNRCIGVRPAASTALGSAPASRSSARAHVAAAHAACSGVRRSCAAQLTDARAVISRDTASVT
eukprot:4769684-Pleurochrysis_carterae.AAC.2